MKMIRQFFQISQIVGLVILLGDVFYRIFMICYDFSFSFIFHFLSLVIFDFTPYVLIAALIYYVYQEDYMLVFFSAFLAQLMFTGLYEYTCQNVNVLVFPKETLYSFYQVVSSMLHSCFMTICIIVFHQKITIFLSKRKSIMSIQQIMPVFGAILGIVYFCLMMFILNLMPEIILTKINMSRGLLQHFLKLFALMTNYSFGSEYLFIVILCLLSIIIPIVQYVFKQKDFGKKHQLFLCVILGLSLFACEPIVIEYFFLAYFPLLYIKIFVPAYLSLFCFFYLDCSYVFMGVVYIGLMIWNGWCIIHYMNNEMKALCQSLLGQSQEIEDDFVEKLIEMVGGCENIFEVKKSKYMTQLFLLDREMVDLCQFQQLLLRFVMRLDAKCLTIYSYQQTSLLSQKIEKQLLQDECW